MPAETPSLLSIFPCPVLLPSFFFMLLQEHALNNSFAQESPFQPLMPEKKTVSRNLLQSYLGSKTLMK